MRNAGWGEYDPQAQPTPDYEFDQCIPWQVPNKDEPPSLVINILKYGPGVEVIMPEKLKEALKKQLNQPRNQYG